MDKKVKKEKNKEVAEKINYEKLAEENLRGWQRAKADYENLVKRSREDFLKTIKSGNKDLVLQILPVIDNFEHALKHTPKELQNDDWAQGVLCIQKQLLDVLRANGVEQIDSLGRDFDPKIHDAVEKIKGGKDSSDDVFIITEEILKGYKMNGELIRPAKVKVGNKKVKK